MQDKTNEKTHEKTPEKTGAAVARVPGALLLALARAAGKDAARPALQCVSADVDERGKIAAWSTDSYRLAVAELDQQAGKACAGAKASWGVDDLKRCVRAADVVELAVADGRVALAVVGKDGAREVPALESPSPIKWRGMLNTARVDACGSERPHIADVSAGYLADACAMVKQVNGAGAAIELRNPGKDGAPLLAMAQIGGKAGGKAGREWSGVLWYLLMPIKLDAAAARPAGWYDVAATRDAAELDKLERIAERRAERVAELEAEMAALKAAPEPEPEPEPDLSTLAGIAASSPALAYWTTPLCEWIAGETKPHSAALKAAGAKWSAKKNAWYRRTAAA